MAVVKINLSCELTEAVKVQYIRGNLFSQDNQANVINVAVFEGGEPTELAGTVTANVIRPDGGTVAVTGGTFEGNVATITMPSAVYAIPGMISVAVKITLDSVVTTIAAFAATVYATSTDTAVDPGTIIPSIQTLIAEIEAAVDSIPADYSSLWATLAPNYSNLTFPVAVGQYCTYDGGFYRCNTAIATQEAWTAAHWTATNIGADLAETRLDVADLEDDVSELKSALNNASEQSTIIDSNYKLYDSDFSITGKYISPTNGTEATNADWSCTNYIFIHGLEHFEITGNTTQPFSAFYDENKNFISGSGSQVKSAFDVPHNYFYIRLSLPTAEISAISYTNFRNRITELSETAYSKADRYNMMGLLGCASKNLIDLSKVVDGKYIIYTTGNEGILNTYSATDYIEIVPGATYAFAGNDDGSQMAFYDKNKTYISGALSQMRSQYTIPNNPDIYYLRWCSLKANKSNFSIIPFPAVNTEYNITTSTGLLVGIENAYKEGATKVIVEAGTYDLINEYKAKYGNSYFDDYTSNYNGLANGYNDRGLWLENIEVVFSQNAFVTCHYTGDNSNVIAYFSAFAVGANVIIDGLNLRSSNCRYGIHPDFNPSTYSKFVMRNCDLEHDMEDRWQVVGAGLGISCDWLFETCIFRTPQGADGKPIFRIHNNISAGAKSIINFRNCYVDGSGVIALKWYGQSNLITECFITGCSYISEPTVDWESGGQPYENIELIKIGNVIRS